MGGNIFEHGSEVVEFLTERFDRVKFITQLELCHREKDLEVCSQECLKIRHVGAGILDLIQNGKVSTLYNRPDLIYSSLIEFVCLIDLDNDFLHVQGFDADLKAYREKDLLYEFSELPGASKVIDDYCELPWQYVVEEIR